MDNSQKIILDLCGRSGSWTKPYKEASYDVRLVTLPENDVRSYVPPKNVYGVLAAPPCTEFSNARYDNGIWKTKAKRDITGGMELVNACLRIIEQCKPEFYAIENPAGLLKTYLGAPQFVFEPWHFGDPWTKRTMVWGKFNLPTKRYSEWESVPKIPELYIRPNRGKPSIAFLHKSAIKHIPQFSSFSPIDDAAFRAITPPSFAQAFYEVNK